MERMNVLAPLERDGKKTYWIRIGRAFRNKDGSINVYLDALPVAGKLQLRDAGESRDGHEDNRGRSRNAANERSER